MKMGEPTASRALMGSTGIVLQPRRKEAEHYTQQQGVQLESTGDTQGGGKILGGSNTATISRSTLLVWPA